MSDKRELGAAKEDAARGEADLYSDLEPEPDHFVESGLQAVERDIPSTRYPLRLTVAHLRMIAEALGVEKAGSADQLRQCIEGRLQTDREDPNVVIVRQNSCGETRLTLADSEGKFLESSPARHEPTTPSPPRTSGDIGKISAELQEVGGQLEEANMALESAKMREREQAQQIAELQAAIHEREEHAARNLESEIRHIASCTLCRETESQTELENKLRASR